MTRKQAYIQALEQFDSNWIKSSMLNPTRYMTKVDILLHALVLRRRGAL